MASRDDARAQVTRESERRSRLAVPAFAGGVLYLLSAIIIQATVSGAPTVGVLQGLSPALGGIANPADQTPKKWRAQQLVATAPEMSTTVRP